MSEPSAAVLHAFGLDGRASRLPGGQGAAYRVGNIVVKPADDAAETAWTCDLLTRLRPDGFRISEPVPTVEGRWVDQGWAASRFVAGLRPVAPRWDEVIAAGLRFCDAAEQVRGDDDGVLTRRTHRWAIADRVAWGEQSVQLRDDTAALFSELAAEFHDGPHNTQFVHGDLSGNVFVDEYATPVILDVSPYVRPRRWAAAIVVCDALLWHGASPDLARAFAAEGDGGLLFRAFAFRLVADELASDLSHGPPPHRRYRSLLATLLP